MVRPKSLFALCALTLLPWLVLGGCGGSEVVDTTQPSTPIPSPPPPPPPPPPPSASPAAIQGSWVTTLSGTAERVTLTLGATSYQISRPPNQAEGTISVSGDRIEFSGSTVCAGTGPYRWTLTGNSLTFTAIGADACPGRSEVIAGYTYSR